MKIKNTKIFVALGSSRAARADVVATSMNKKGDLESSLRTAYAQIFGRAHKQRVLSVAVSDLGSVAKGLPTVGAAKILAQEILKFLEISKTTIREIKICLPDRKNVKIFKDTIYGYIRHIQEDLGKGPYVTVDIIIELPQGIVLIERSNPPYGWALPGGFVDVGESLEQAAIRETKEETNLNLKNLRQFRAYSEPNRDPRFHTVSTVFIAKGVGKPRFGDDAKGLKIVPYKKLFSLQYAFDHNNVIRDYLKEKP